MKKFFARITLIVIFGFLPIYFSIPFTASAQTPPPCPPGVIGCINNPVSELGNVCKATKLVSNIIRLLSVGAGLYTLINIVLAGISFIGSSGNPEKIQQAWAKIYQSLVGILIIFIAIALTGVLGFLLFGSATAILAPTITGPAGGYSPC